MSAEAYGPAQDLLPDSADFRLSPQEIEKGQKAVDAFLSTVKTGDSQKSASDALDTLAAVISGGHCDHRSFPWQQLRAHHTALALSIIKARGAPARIEAMRCRADDTRKFHQVPEIYPGKVVHRIRTSLIRVIEACSVLGFIDEEDSTLIFPQARGARADSAPRKVIRDRLLTEGEVRALLSACDMEESPSAPRDALMISLAFHGGLKTVDLINLTLDSLIFDDKKSTVNIRFKAPGAKRARKIPLQNADLIALEDWLEVRGRKPGALFCPVFGRSRTVEVKRLSAAAMRTVCDERAQQAGVLAFSPNDLARSGMPKLESSRKRKTPPARRSSADSVLFAEHGQETGPAQSKDLIFPYRSARANH